MPITLRESSDACQTACSFVLSFLFLDEKEKGENSKKKCQSDGHFRANVDRQIRRETTVTKKQGERVLS